MMVKYRTHFDTLELCDRAGDMLKRAGFVHYCTSMKTEATYYRWPGREELIRVAAHGKCRTRKMRLGNVVAKITFNGNMHDPPGMMNISEEKIKTIVAAAIGHYFLKSRAS